jgi:hypothetical protein
LRTYDEANFEGAESAEIEYSHSSCNMGVSFLEALSNGAPVTVEHFSEIIYFPMRLAKGDKPHSQTPLSFDEIEKTLKPPEGGVWKDGNTPGGLASLPGKLIEVHAAWAKYHHAQAHAYFHPFVRQFLFDTTEYENDYRMAFHRTDIKKIGVTLTGSSAMQSTSVELTVNRCELELFRMNVAVLVLEVSANTPISLRTAQALQDQLRRTFAPYFDDYALNGNVEAPFGSHFAQRVALYGENDKLQTEFLAKSGNASIVEALHKQEFDKRFETTQPNGTWSFKARMADSICVAAHWQYLLSPLVVNAGNAQAVRFIPLGDDRLPIATYLAVDQPKSIPRGDWVRLAYADAPGSDRLPYAEQFLENFETDVCYDRFWYLSGESTDKPSRLLNTGLVFCWVGDANDPAFFTNSKNGAHATFRHIYSRLALIAHMQKACMLAASARISELSERHSADQTTPPAYISKQKDISHFYNEFIEFTHVYWFDEISPQIQGRELFAKLQEQLGTKALYTEVRQELTDLTSAVTVQVQQRQADDQGRMADTSVKLTTYAAWFGALSVATSFLAIEFFKDKGPGEKGPAYAFLDLGLAQYAVVFSTLLGVATVVYWATKLLIKFANWFKKEPS